MSNAASVRLLVAVVLAACLSTAHARFLLKATAAAPKTKAVPSSVFLLLTADRVDRNTTECLDLALNCGTYAKYCDPKWTWMDESFGEVWCPATCSLCEIGSDAETGSSSSGSGSDDSAGSEHPELEWELLDLVNAAREKEGLDSLCLNSKLSVAAAEHSADQAKMGKMAHEGSDGSTAGDRATAAGYVWYGIGENVAWNYPDVQSAFDAWMESEGHRANILHPEFQHMGAARTDSLTATYWTQVFGASPSEGCS